MQEAQLLVQGFNCLIGNSQQFVWAPFVAILDLPSLQAASVGAELSRLGLHA